MPDRSIIIIGAGLAGLSTGCYAQMNGYSSRVFEHHSAPGGVAACWKRKGYLIDGGIHFLMGHRPGQSLYDMYTELGITQSNRFPDLDTYGRFVDEASGRELVVTRDLERLEADLKAAAPQDAGIVDGLVKGARALRGVDIGAVGMGKPPELEGPLDVAKMAWGGRRALRYMVGKYGRPVAEYAAAIRDPWLREVVPNMFLPEVPVWFLLMLMGLLADNQVGMMADGSQSFALSIERRYKDLGGEVTYRSTVREIIVEGDKAVGVRLADGSEHHADAVVSAADGYSTIFSMLGGRYVDGKIRDRYAGWKLIRPLVMVSFGVAREFADEPWLHIIGLRRPFTVGSQETKWIMLRLFNYSDRFAPPGKTVVQASFESEWDYWNGLKDMRIAYEAEKQRVAAEIVTRLEKHYPGISLQVEMIDVTTPYTTWR